MYYNHKIRQMQKRWNVILENNVYLGARSHGEILGCDIKIEKAYEPTIPFKHVGGSEGIERDFTEYLVKHYSNDPELAEKLKVYYENYDGYYRYTSVDSYFEDYCEAELDKLRYEVMQDTHVEYFELFADEWAFWGSSNGFLQLSTVEETHDKIFKKIVHMIDYESSTTTDPVARQALSNGLKVLNAVEMGLQVVATMVQNADNHDKFRKFFANRVYELYLEETSDNDDKE